MFKKLVDMEMDDERQLDTAMPIAMPERSRYPYGLRLSLTHDDLGKLRLPIPDKDDEIDFWVRCVVTHVHSDDGPMGKSGCVELQVEKMYPCDADEAEEEAEE